MIQDGRFGRMLERFKSLRISTCVKQTATEMQKAIRIEAADSAGMVQCVTCNAVHPWNSGRIHAGHFVGSRRNGVLFDERGIFPQCNRCNTYLNGNQEAYAKFMLDKYGQDVCDELLQNRNQVVTYTREELVRMRISYMDRVSKAKKRLSAKPF